MPGRPGFVSLRTARIATVVLCGLLVILSLHIIISLALTSRDTGQCLLYADLNDFGPCSVCTYIHTVTSIFHLIICLARAVLLAVVLAGVVEKEAIRDGVLDNKYTLIGCTVVDILACFLTLVSCGLVSHGFSVMCSNVFDTMKCGAVPIYSSIHSVFIRNYYPRLSIAQVSLWISFVVWLLLVLVDVFILWEADILSQFQILPQHKDNNVSRNTNQSHRSAVTHLFRAGDSDTDSGPRTPPPQRPLPPRPPPAAAATTAAARRLMEKY